MPEKIYVITENYTLALWEDSMAGEKAHVERASSVEPDESGKWTVKLSGSRINGEYAGKYIADTFEMDYSKALLAMESGEVKPEVTDKRASAKRFLRRQEALDAEREFINRRVLMKGVMADDVRCSGLVHRKKP